MVEYDCKLPNYELEVHSTSLIWGDVWVYRIVGKGERYKMVLRTSGGFNNMDDALQWGRRALWCLSLGDR